jgi:NAD(P)-dependent dehydrogenase (short-subunit alcohol dehydrogenase family)
MEHAAATGPRVAIVTGGASGIGRRTAQVLARDGVDTYLIDTDETAGEQTARALRAEGGAATFLRGSVSDEAFLDTAVDRVISEQGRIDHLVNAAGILDGYATLEETSPALLDRVLAVNLLGPVQLCRRVVPHMVAAGYGKVVNVTSWAASVGDAGGMSYTVSKHGLLGLTRNLAASYGRHGVRVNAVCPGAIGTGLRASTARELAGFDLDMSRGLGASGPERLQSLIPLGFPGSDTDVAELIAFVCSARGDYIHGASLPVDGGFLCRGA